MGRSVSPPFRYGNENDKNNFSNSSQTESENLVQNHSSPSQSQKMRKHKSISERNVSRSWLRQKTLSSSTNASSQISQPILPGNAKSSTLAHNNLDVQQNELRITLNRGNSGYGFNIVGGIDQPHLSNDSGVFISRI